MKPLGVVWTDTWVELHFEYDLRMIHELRRHRCRWNPERQCWEVDQEDAPKLIRHAERLGYREAG